jgi:hypothetical protein
MLRARAVLIVSLVLAVAVAACSGDDDDSATAKPTSAADAVTTTTARAATVNRPAGPAADVSQELTGGNGVFIGSANTAIDPGVVQNEYVASGTATSYKAEGELSGDGRWTFTPDGTAPYRTRILVRRPKKASDFSGTVVVEWLNVSGGVDADAEYASLREEIVRQGHAWVGVSAQLIGVMGGPVLVSAPVGGDIAGKGLVGIDPARYGSLTHPGDGYAYDIYTQVARALRDGGALDGLKPQYVLAAGESQSAIALVTYINGVQPLAHAFDGFFVHSRGGAGLPLAAPGKSADLVGSIGGAATIFRTDTDAPIMDVQTESDVVGVLNSAPARQDDSDTFRLWEVPGTAHADAHLVGPIADQMNCGAPINNGALHLVAKAALRDLVRWVSDGTAPPKAPRLELTSGATPEIARDQDGNALGGIRNPLVDVPVDKITSIQGPAGSTICLLSGSTLPLPDARLAELYSSRADYTAKFTADADKMIKAGFVLKDDRDALLAYAQPDRIAG